MSMPVIEPSKTTRCQAITDVIESVALQQTGLSHIINAEGEKIQMALKLAEKDSSILLSVNNSVNSMLNSITRLEVILQGKLELFKDCLCYCDTKEEHSIDLMLEVNENGGSIKETELADTYLYSPGTTRGSITILTEPTSKIEAVGELPTGWSLINNVLTTPLDPNWKLQQVSKLRIVDETSSNSFIINIVNDVV